MTEPKMFRLDVFTFLGIMWFAYCQNGDFNSSINFKTLIKVEECSHTVKLYDYVQINYVLRLENGSYIGALRDKRNPYGLEIGGLSSPGWSTSLVGMCKGEIRQLKLPPERAFGKNGYLNLIPPDATILYEVEILSINEWETFKNADIDDDSKISPQELRYLAARNMLKTKKSRPPYSKPNDELAQVFFSAADTDRDGYLNKEEYAKGMLHIEL